MYVFTGSQYWSSYASSAAIAAGNQLFYCIHNLMAATIRSPGEHSPTLSQVSPASLKFRRTFFAGTHYTSLLNAQIIFLQAMKVLSQNP